MLFIEAHYVSPINLPTTKPDWVVEIILGSICLIHHAIAEETRRWVAIFFRNSCGISPFGIQLIIHCHAVNDKIPEVKLKFKEPSITNFNLDQNTLKKSAGKPSIPGVLLLFIFLRAVVNS